MKKKSGFGWFVKQAVICILGILIVFIIVGLIPGLSVTYYSYTSSKLPASFDGFKILQISDFHLKDFGEDEKKLLSKIDELAPDIIVFTGDMIDGYHDSIDNMNHLMNALSVKCKIYQVNGNHENDNYTQKVQLDKLYKTAGTIDLNDSSAVIKHADGEIVLHGLDWINEKDANAKMLEEKLKDQPDTAAVDILLCHNPLIFPELAKFNYELILSGHLHGGVLRLPIVGGLLNTDGSLGAEYEAGVYQNGASTMITSRGLGDIQLAIPRFNNKSELVLITLHSVKSGN